MSDGTSDPRRAPLEVVRSKRFELVDDRGQVRAVLANLSFGDDEYLPGLTLLAPGGHQRVWLLAHDQGPELGFDMGGNNVLILGVTDPGRAAVSPGPHLILCDPDGDVVQEWRVDLDGELQTRGPGI